MTTADEMMKLIEEIGDHVERPHSELHIQAGARIGCLEMLLWFAALKSPEVADMIRRRHARIPATTTTTTDTP